MSLGGGPSGTYIGLPPRSLKRISHDLGREINPEEIVRELMATPNRREEAKDALINYCLAQPALQLVLGEFGADGNTLKELYSRGSAHRGLANGQAGIGSLRPQ